MLRIKRLYTFIIQTFIPVFFMTFIICLFILLMQFLWRYIEDLVGKGLDNSVIAELFFYATLSLIPMALPLSILLASLMAFGNLGERLELLAIKASGVSLLRAMRPLIILVAAISVGAFFFQNEAMPRINIKFRTLLSSIKHKSPELEIPEGSFYSGISGYSIYVSKKDPETKLLHNMMIYDTSNGFSNMTVTVCDSARMRVSANKDFLLLNLYNGRRFANLKNGTINLQNQNSTYSSQQNKFVPYYRENFKEETIIIPFEGSFDRMDESAMDGHQSAKNITMLNHSIDSLRIQIDSLNKIDRTSISNAYITFENKELVNNTNLSTRQQEEAKADSVSFAALNFDSIVDSYKAADIERIYDQAASNLDQTNSFYIFQRGPKIDIQKNIRYHEVELHRKFVLSFACLIFFFIGAPLGAIIRKGGLGMPVVVSVLFFIVYYIFDNIGVKMARDGVWNIWQGMWLSSMILFPIGVFLTYKAMNDSDLFNAEAYGKYFKKILRIKDKKELQGNNDIHRRNILESIPALSTLHAEPELVKTMQKMDNDKLRDIVLNYKIYDYDKNTQLLAAAILKENGADLNELIDKQDYNYKNTLYSVFCDSSYLSIAGYLVALLFLILQITLISSIIEISYLFLFLRSLSYYLTFYTNMNKKEKVYHTIIIILLLVAYPVMFFYIRKKMLNDVEKTRQMVLL